MTIKPVGNCSLKKLMHTDRWELLVGFVVKTDFMVA